MSFSALQINQTHWRKAGQRLIEMAIAEFLYEEIIHAKSMGHGNHQIILDKKTYQFTGHQYQLGHWHIQVGSVKDLEQPSELTWNLHEFMHAFSVQAEIKPFTHAYLIKEMNNTWLAEAHLFDENRLTSAAVLDHSHDQIEGMLRGHPWLIMSKGRMGFGYDDYLSSAPELSPNVRVLWLAVHQDLAEFRSTSLWTAEQLYQHELDQDEYDGFIKKIEQLGLKADQYYFIPVHGWQWNQWLVTTYANEIVNQKIITLDLSRDTFVPMQSIRTLCNTRKPERHYIKLPVSIFNTAVYRGLPSKRNLAAPAVTAWLKNIHAQDVDLQKTGLILLGEVATLTIHQPCYDQIEAAPYQFKELFGCLWRESVAKFLKDQQQVLSQAALLHRDITGVSVLSTLIHASGFDPLTWLRRFAEVSVTPLLICLYKYGVAFSPHGENTMLIHQNGQPQALVLKDFVDDINLVDEDFPELADLPPEAGLLLRHSASELSHFIFTGLFIVHYRYICNVFLEDFPELSEVDFWQTISDVIDEFHQNNPNLSDRIDKFSMFRPQFEKICLNRVRLFTTSYNDEAERPVPVFLDPIANPVSPETLALWQNNKATQTTHYHPLTTPISPSHSVL